MKILRWWAGEAIHLPLRHIFGGVTFDCVYVVNLAKRTSLLSWRNSIETNVKLGTVFGIFIFGMWVRNAKSICGCLCRALEATACVQS